MMPISSSLVRKWKVILSAYWWGLWGQSCMWCCWGCSCTIARWGTDPESPCDGEVIDLPGGVSFSMFDDASLKVSCSSSSRAGKSFSSTELVEVLDCCTEYLRCCVWCRHNLIQWNVWLRHGLIGCVHWLLVSWFVWLMQHHSCNFLWLPIASHHSCNMRWWYNLSVAKILNSR